MGPLYSICDITGLGPRHPILNMQYYWTGPPYSICNITGWAHHIKYAILLGWAHATQYSICDISGQAYNIYIRKDNGFFPFMTTMPNVSIASFGNVHAVTVAGESTHIYHNISQHSRFTFSCSHFKLRICLSAVSAYTCLALADECVWEQMVWENLIYGLVWQKLVRRKCPTTMNVTPSLIQSG